MTSDWVKKGRDFAKFIDELAPQERDEASNKNLQQATAEHSAFVHAFDVGECYLCGKPLKTFSSQAPCLHWLLKPKGFKKKHLPPIASKFGVFQIQCYLRWVANRDKPFKNINDFPGEGTSGKLIEVTIRYDNLEWSLSCSESDYLGHASTSSANFPHYHFQMRVDGRQFVNYNDFHLPLTQYDVVNLEALRARPDLIHHPYPGGEGIGDVLTDENAEFLIRASGSTTNPAEAALDISTMMLAEEGKTISGDDLYEIVQEARAKGVTVASLAHKLENATIKTLVSPGPGVVERAPRKGGRRGA